MTNTMYSAHVTNNVLTLIIRSCLYKYMPLLISHDSVLLQQKGTEVSVTLSIGHMIDIKYNHTFNRDRNLTWQSAL